MKKSFVRLQGAASGFHEHKSLLLGIALAFFFAFMLFTPRLHQPQSYHRFSDRRNLIGVPNSLNVISTFPFLIVGVVGLVLCLHGNYFGVSIRGEVLGWACFYAGVTATAFGSAYYHMKPDDARLMWDRLPMNIAFSSLMAIFIIERIDERKGTFLLFPLLFSGILSVAYWRFSNDLRPYVIMQLVPYILIPTMAITLPSRYTHSLYWLWCAGLYLLAKLEEVMDKKIYRWTNYGVSGHTMQHLCSFMVLVLITVILARRNTKIERQSLVERWRIQIRTRFPFQEDKSLLPQSRSYGTTILQDEAERLAQP